MQSSKRKRGETSESVFERMTQKDEIKTAKRKQRLEALSGEVHRLKDKGLAGSPQEDGVDSPFFNFLKQKDAFPAQTNFLESELEGLFADVQQFVPEAPRRGRKNVIHWRDALLYLLMIYKGNRKLAEVSSLSKCTKGTLTAAILRIRPILHAYLIKKWVEDPVRPDAEVIRHQQESEVAACYDHTFVKVGRPVGSFDEAKRYYDAKHKCYAFKKAVVVSSMHPHYAVMFGAAIPGAKHDYTDLKENYKMLLPYLERAKVEEAKTERQPRTEGKEEKRRSERTLPSSSSSAPLSWKCSFDKGYVGPEADTPGLRRHLPIKCAQSSADHVHNMKWSKSHVIERYFGRMKQLWEITAERYRFTSETLDQDFENCALLTNLHIKHHQLTPEDETFYLVWKASIAQEADDRAATVRLKRTRHSYVQQARAMGLEPFEGKSDD
jgi:hypothetical protein